MNTSNTLRQPSRSTGLALTFITVGVLSAIWAAVWYFFLKRRETDPLPPADWNYYVCAGLFFSGVALLIIGVLVGRIGREARQGDAPVGQVTAAAVTPEGAAPAVPVPAAPVVQATPAATAAPRVVAPPQKIQQS